MSNRIPPLLPYHLAGHQAQGVIENEPIAQFELGWMKNFVYLLIDWPSRICAIVDPQSNLKPIDEALSRFSLKLESILLTHTHHDHVAGVAPLVKAYPGIPLFVGEKDLHRLDKKIIAAATIHALRGGENFSVGNITVDAIHTPGHSAGELSLFIAGGAGAPPYLFTGDTVFIRDCGRTDFPDGDNEEMFASLQKIKALPPATVILCGHHYKEECATTIGQEMTDSPPFRCKSVQELAAIP